MPLWTPATESKPTGFGFRDALDASELTTHSDREHADFFVCLFDVDPRGGQAGLRWLLASASRASSAADRRERSVPALRPEPTKDNSSYSSKGLVG